MAADAAHREYELKFRARVADLGKFKKAVSAASGTALPWRKARQSNQYFDTADHRMAERGVAVRIRRVNGTAVQTVKADGAGLGGAMDRREWERPVDDGALVLDALPDDIRRAIGKVSQAELAPVMDIDTTRETATLTRKSAFGPDLVVEAALDKSVLAAGDRTERFAECELELVQGDIPTFFQLAAEIHARCPLPLSGTTKSARGYRLLDGNRPAAHHMPKLALTPGLTVHAALSAIFAACLGNIVANEEACLDGGIPEGVHQMRVSVRRLRSALVAFAPVIDPARVAWMDDELKWLGRCLGPARDWDVFVGETLDIMAGDNMAGDNMAGGGLDADAVAALRRAAMRRRKRAYDAVRETLRSDRYARVIFRLTGFAAQDGWLTPPIDANDPLLRPLGKAAGTLLRRPYKKLMRRADGLADRDFAARHKVRIRLKRLRYAVEFLHGVYPRGRTKKFMRALRELQDRFGRFNDVAQAMRLTDELVAANRTARDAARLAAAGAQVHDWSARALADIEPRLIRDWTDFAATPPFWKKKS